jgi:hypothetical protein
MAKGQSNAQVASEPKTPTDAQMRKQGMSTLSSRIRHLHALGMPTAEIVKVVKRGNGEHPKYQHVRNVLKQPLAANRPSADANHNSGNQTATA